MFAPRPFDVAREMVRVARPGGRIVMGNWIPNDPTLVAQILKIAASYAPPPPEGFISPMTWGVEETVTERFTAAGVPESGIAFERATYTFRLPWHAIGIRRRVQDLLRADDERVRGRYSKRPRDRAAEGNGEPVRGLKRQREPGADLDPCSLLARHGHALRHRARAAPTPRSRTVSESRLTRAASGPCPGIRSIPSRP